MPEPWQRSCPTCEGLARDLQEAWQADERDIRARFRDTAESEGQNPEASLLPWITSLAQTPDDEFETLQAGRYPRVADVRRKWKEHETDSGHSGLAEGWRAAFIFEAVMRSGYAGFLKPRD